MRAAFVAAALVLLAGIGTSAIPVAYRESAVGMSLVPTAGLPITLSAGPDGSTTIGVNKTSAASTVSAGMLGSQSSNTTKLTNTWGAGLRVRLVVVSTSNLDAECVRCDLQLRHGGTTSTQITIANGVVTQASGPWVTINAAGAAQHTWWLYAVGQGAGFADKLEQVRVALEIEPAAGGSPRANYTAFSATTFRV